MKAFLDQKGVTLPKEFMTDQFGPRHAEAAFDAIEHPNYANDGIMGPPQVGPPRNLQEFIRKKSALWGLATKAERDGNAPLARTIKGYYHELNDAAERGYPEYRPVNDRAADARAIDQAQVAGEKFPMQKDRKQALAVQQVSKLSPDEQQGFRQGLSTNIQTQLGRMGARHNAGKAFDKNQFRDMLQTL